MSVPDPYKALNLTHSATAAEIKRSYRELARQLHPDRLTSVASSEERDRATAQFAKIAAAYSLLSDPQRKAQYDHVYKFGGYDDNNEDSDRRNHRRSRSSTASCANSPDATDPASNPQYPGNHRKRKSTGIGYTCVDPLAFLWTNGRVQSKMAVAGIQIPSRLQHAHGLRFAFSSAHLSTSPSGGTQQWQSHTTQFVQGKKYTRVETTTIHADGRREVVIEDEQDDRSRERRYVIPPPPQPQAQPSPTSTSASTSSSSSPPQSSTVQEPTSSTTAPWYAHAWHGIKDKLMMCYHPCTVVHATAQ